MDKKELIAQYFSKKRTPEAKKEFDRLLVSDSAFAKEVTFQKNIKAVIEKEERAAVKLQLLGFELEENATPNYKKGFVAALIIALLGLTSLWFFNNSIDVEKLYVENFQPYRNVVQPIVRGETKTDLKTKAFTAYETKKYNEALLYFNQLLKESPDETIAFYKANVLLKLNKTKEAILILENNLKTSDSLDAKNNWYLALAHLRVNNIGNAKAILNELSNTSSFKNENVKQLLKKLD